MGGSPLLQACADRGNLAARGWLSHPSIHHEARLMRALMLTRYGGPEATELRDDVPPPRPGPAEVLVRVRAAGLNPVDFKTREGQLKVIRRYPLPAVMGNEIAGVVDAVGSDVRRFSPGDRVYARLDKDRMGGLAEWASVHEDHLARMPASLSFEAAAAVPLAALTALQALRDELRLAKGQRVFISGGAGGVGTFAIQIAKHLGATVATTASPRGEALVRRLGADLVVDYTRERFQDLLHDYDAAFDLLGGPTLASSFSVLKRGATVVSIAGLPEPETARRDLRRGAALTALFWLISFATRRTAARHGVRYRYLFMHPSGADLETIAALIDGKAIEVVVDKIFPFDQAKEALGYLEGGRAKGKVVVSVSS
ncbi:NADP-dependent oxidoreductase [Roseateles violae]|uniref:NADP-dependent oxidoreductase n=1 Tax=Roseateles violae TaxID=3058042 RepID=A0ABT8DRB2_9BURK|nr:NADP-dependent oxidoreductase [Pelomonas sp. PFR6]MDN3919474.1 NADP-dependent oxidoreductase [Pelomonas sp. PFR6]